MMRDFSSFYEIFLTKQQNKLERPFASKYSLELWQWTTLLIALK
jgi:hypothetical protein